MELSNILAPTAVKVVASTSSKKRLLHDLADLAFSAYELPQGVTVEALMERETLGPTGVGHGVALPHARLSGVDRVWAPLFSWKNLLISIQ